MKLYLHVNKEPLTGYNNINLITDTINMQNLDHLCEKAECIELILDNVLSYIPLKTLENFLKNLITRLRYNGKLIITDFNLDSVIDKYSNGVISMYELNDKLFDSRTSAKRSGFTIQYIENIIKSSNISIESIQLNDDSFMIIAKRKI